MKGTQRGHAGGSAASRFMQRAPPLICLDLRILPPLKVCKALPWLLLMLPSALDSTAVSVIGIHLVIIH